MIASSSTTPNGTSYILPVKLLYSGDAPISFQFYFSDGQGGEVKSQESSLQITKSGSQPLLSWVTDVGYQNGVDPNSSMADANFSFKVRYQDPDYKDGDPAPTVELLIDRNFDRTNTVTESYPSLLFILRLFCYRQDILFTKKEIYPRWRRWGFHLSVQSHGWKESRHRGTCSGREILHKPCSRIELA